MLRLNINIKGFVFPGLRYNETSHAKEDIMEDREKKVAAASLLILAGGIVGAGLALLMAPQSGQRTRKDIVRYAKKTKLRAGEAVDDLAATVSDLVDTIGDKTDDLLDKGKDAAGSARKDLIRLIEEGASRLEQFRTKLSRM
jgi:gas vesicle protein